MAVLRMVEWRQQELHEEEKKHELKSNLSWKLIAHNIFVRQCLSAQMYNFVSIFSFSHYDDV
jgi:hypothetical protein